MHTVELNVGAIEQMRRKKREDGLSLAERIALNLFWRHGVRAAILARVFNVSKNTVYYTVLNKRKSVAAKEAHARLEREGEEACWNKYVSDKQISLVNAELDASMKQRR